MSPSIRTSGVGMMIASAIVQGAALLFVALAEEPFPIALILLGSGVLLFLAGAVLCDQRSDHSYRDPRLTTYSEDL